MHLQNMYAAIKFLIFYIDVIFWNIILDLKMASEQIYPKFWRDKVPRKVKDESKADGSKEQRAMDKAVWESKSHAIFIKHCKEFIRVGDRSVTHFTTDGWNLLVERFTKRPTKTMIEFD